MKTMQYMMMIYQGAEWPSVPVDEKNRVHEACGAWHEELVQSGHSRACFGLQPPPTATTLRGGSDGKVLITDGPFIETKEVFGGLEVLECADLDEALAIAQRFPALRSGHCHVEVRPLVPGGGCRD